MRNIIPNFFSSEVKDFLTFLEQYLCDRHINVEYATIDLASTIIVPEKNNDSLPRKRNYSELAFLNGKEGYCFAYRMDLSVVTPKDIIFAVSTECASKNKSEQFFYVNGTHDAGLIPKLLKETSVCNKFFKKYKESKTYMSYYAYASLYSLLCVIVSSPDLKASLEDNNLNNLLDEVNFYYEKSHLFNF